MPVEEDRTLVDSPPAAQPQRRRLPSHLAWAAVVLVVALAARSIWVAYAPSNPTDGRIINDTWFYYYSAANLADAGRYVQPLTGAYTAYWPPGYPFLLAGLFKAFGAHVSIAWGVNIVLGALTCVTVYHLGRLAFGLKTGVVAGVMLALFPGHIFFSSLVLSEVTFTFLVAAAMLLIALSARQDDKRRTLLLLVMGLVAGAAALVRGQGLLLLPLAALFWWLQHDWRLALRWTATAGVAAFVLIAPWTIRNYVRLHDFVPISTNVGGNLYVGNFEGATGHMVGGAGDWARDYYAYLPPEEQEVAMNKRLLREGLAFMFSHPVREVELTASKLRGLYEDDEEALRGIPDPMKGETIPHADRIADVANVYYFGVLALSGCGFVLWLRPDADARSGRPSGRNRRSTIALPLLVVLLFTLGQLPFFNDPRFHYPMLPAFALLAAAGLLATVEGARKYSLQRGSTPPNSNTAP